MKERSKAINKTPEIRKENSATQSQRTELPFSVNSPTDQIVYLHKTIGNQAVQRLFKSGVIQAKLKIGEPNDNWMLR